jgi:transmembrane sensor
MTQSSRIDDIAQDEALAWREALKRDDPDWDGYVAWLEADPRHRDAINQLDLADAAVADHREQIRYLLSADVRAVRPRTRVSRILLSAGAAAAAVVAAIVVVPAFRATDSVRSYAADDRKARVVDLGDGIRVALAPGSRILVRDGDATRIELSKGDLFLDVRHDPARTLTVSAGNYSITDVGTRFAVNRAGNELLVGVSEGAVAVSSSLIKTTVRVAAGQQLSAGRDGPTLSRVAPSDVASWRSGRLSYSNAPLSLVVADISRYAGKPVRVDPSLENAHFSGSLVIGDGSRLLSDLALVIGARIDRDKDHDRISAADR